MLRVRIAATKSDSLNLSKPTTRFPLRLVAERTIGTGKQNSKSKWLIIGLADATLLRVVLLQSGEVELMIICHHAIADGLSGVYLMRDILQGLEANI